MAEGQFIVMARCLIPGQRHKRRIGYVTPFKTVSNLKTNAKRYVLLADAVRDLHEMEARLGKEFAFRVETWANAVKRRNSPKLPRRPGMKFGKPRNPTPPEGG